ncbi:MAG: UDP-N-acetylmuramoyl-L-alanyl-D-glutamate--2,6-diaminopimelate ligase [Oscillospiraceae bacterium]
MKLAEMLKDIKVLELAADVNSEIAGISYDSRRTKPGDMFVAISGFESDGYAYIPSAIENGACVILCDRAPKVEIPYVLVENCRHALAIASRNYFGDPAGEMCVIGVTGTNGKTTSTYLMKHLLEEKLNAKVGLVGTNGNMIGDELIHTERTTPESFELQQLFREMADAGCTHVVMEVSSHSLTLDRVAGIDFKVGAFTNLTQDHLDFHHTMEEYAEAKSRLFMHCACGCINMDDKWHDKIAEIAKCRLLTYSADGKDADLTASDIRLSASGVEFTAAYMGDTARVKLAIPGKFSVYNALNVMSMGLALGLSIHDCADAISGAKGVKGRMEVVPTDGDYTILIDYAHTPDALENALRALRDNVQGRLIVLFGCGGDRDRTKRPIMGGIAADNADFVIVTSDNPRTEDPNAIIDEIVEGLKNKTTPHKVICDRAEAIKWAIDNHLPDDVILLAGKGHEDYQVVGHEKRHMDEREIVAEHIEKRNG